jgi:sulfonate transport system substrate-binding protein
MFLKFLIMFENLYDCCVSKCRICENYFGFFGGSKRKINDFLKGVFKMVLGVDQNQFRGIKKIFLVAMTILFLVTSKCFASDSGKSYPKPDVIRVGASATGGTSNKASLYTWGALYERKLLEEEFEKDGIKIEWNFFRGATAALNEAFAAGVVDIGGIADLGSIVGRANGIKYKAVSIIATRIISYVAVGANSGIEKIEDLKGKKVATSNGSSFHFAWLAIAELFGIKDGDYEFISMGPADAMAALVAGEVDAAVLSLQVFKPRDEGKIKVIYSTEGTFPDKSKAYSAAVLTEDFINKYPEVSERILKAIVRASEWSSKDENFEEFLDYASHTATPKEGLREWIETTPLLQYCSPLIDDLARAHWNEVKDLSLQLGVIEEDFNLDDLLDDSLLNKALKETGLENFWTKYGPDGKPQS